MGRLQFELKIINLDKDINWSVSIYSFLSKLGSINDAYIKLRIILHGELKLFVSMALPEAIKRMKLQLMLLCLDAYMGLVKLQVW